MFDLGFSELFLIAIIALVVLGPERLPKAARFAGLWMRRARTQWQSVKSEFENEIADEQLRNTLKQTRDDLREAHDSVVRGGQDLQREFTDIEVAARNLDNTNTSGTIPSPAGIAAIAGSTVPDALGHDVDAPPTADASSTPEAPFEQAPAAGDNYYLEELDEDPYPDGFPTVPPRTTESDGQR